jgi:HTH-type transcriptional regulator/antitoxin HigA
MPNTAKTPGKNDIKTFIKAAQSKQAAYLLDVIVIRDDAGHKRAVEMVGDLMDIIGDNPENPLYRLIDALADAIAHYESQIYDPPPDIHPADRLRFFMENHGLKQSDLADIFGTQSVVSDILNKKREMNLSHIRKLSKRFQVSPAIFIA